MTQILDKSYGVGVFVINDNETKIFNVIKKGATIQCSGSSNDYMSSDIGNGNITTITICGTVLVAWLSGVALENIIAFIWSKVIKFDY